MPRHFLTNDTPVAKELTITEIQERYRLLRGGKKGKLNEGMDMPMGSPSMGGGPLGGGAAGGPDMGTPAGQIMPPPIIAPPITPAGGVPGAQGDAALSAPPKIGDAGKKEDKKEVKPGEEKEETLKSMRKLLKGMRESLLEIEMKLREMGALDDDEDDDDGEVKAPGPKDVPPPASEPAPTPAATVSTAPGI